MRSISKRLPTLSVTLAVIAFSASVHAQIPNQVTFTKDVAPILQEHCQVCHRAGTFAPMSLLTYEEVRPWAKSIQSKVSAREMPPWHIDKNVGVRHFRNDASLSDEEIATIVKWVELGAPRGNPGDMPPPRQFEDLDKWHISPLVRDRACAARRERPGAPISAPRR